jgi:hypothetical protein
MCLLRCDQFLDQRSPRVEGAVDFLQLALLLRFGLLPLGAPERLPALPEIDVVIACPLPDTTS